MRTLISPMSANHTIADTLRTLSFMMSANPSIADSTVQTLIFLMSANYTIADTLRTLIVNLYISYNCDFMILIILYIFYKYYNM